MRTITRVRTELRAAEKKMRQASERRRVLPIGSPRARVTTANAKWSIACEAVNRLTDELRALEEAESTALNAANAEGR